MKRKNCYIIVGLILLTQSCNETTMVNDLARGPASRQNATRSSIPVVSNSVNLFVYSIDDKGESKSYANDLSFTTDSVSYQLSVTEFAGGSLRVFVTDSAGVPILADTISCDTLVSRSFILGKVPHHVAIDLVAFSGKFSFSIVRKDVGAGFDMLGFWKWEYGYTGDFAPVYHSPHTLGYHILLRLGKDSVLTVYKNDSLIYAAPFWTTPGFGWFAGDQILHLRHGNMTSYPWMGLSDSSDMWFPYPDTLYMTGDCHACGQFIYSRIRFGNW